MTDNRAAVDTGVAAMSRLADRLAAVAQPMPVAAPAPGLPRFSPAVTAALGRNAAAIASARRRSQRGIFSLAVESFVSACTFIPYAVVALALRAPVLLRRPGAGQRPGRAGRQDRFFRRAAAAGVKAETLAAFANQYPALPISSTLVAYFVSYAEFALPICLLLGFGTRTAAFGLLLISLMIQFCSVPMAIWSMHLYWSLMLVVLLSLGPGQISIDHIIRLVTRR